MIVTTHTFLRLSIVSSIKSRPNDSRLPRWSNRILPVSPSNCAYPMHQIHGVTKT